MIRRFRKQRLAFITLVYWFLLIYIIAALVWWFISLEQQNNLMYSYRVTELNKDDPSYSQKFALLQTERQRKTAQYVGEGSTFLLLILLGAVFVYRATRKQIRLSQQQQNFMMAVTHELKTPIAVTRLNLETLQKRKLDEQQQEKLINLALDETNRLNLLTNNILVAAQLESGNYTINKQQVDLSKLIKDSISDFAKRFRSRRINAEVANGVFIEGELMLIQMMINNLVENAFKYSPKDKQVHVKLFKGHGNACLRVIDEGAGIQSSEKKKIFEKFYRSGDESVRTPILRNNESAESIIRKSIFIKAVANESSVFVGQPFLVTYKLYACIFCKSRVSKQPTFNSCSITELGYPLDPDIEIVNGKKFHVFTIRKVQVTPLEEGVLHLGTVEVENLVPFVHDNNMQDNFSLTINNDPLQVQVKALPEENKPSDFSNIVGSFSMSATLDTNNVPVGENATLSITIKGKGNFTGIHLPEIHWPRGTEHFEASDTQHIDDNSYPVIGYKRFTVPFIGSRLGHAEIGPVSFNYFDPADALYKTITVDKLPVEFSKAVSNKESLAHIVQEDITNRKYLWIVGAIAATVVIILLAGAKMKKKKVIVPKIEEPATEKQDTPQQDNGAEILSALNRLGYVDDDKKFLQAASYLLIASLQIKLSAPENITADELIELLRRNDAHDLSKMCKQIFADCNRNLYTPDAEEGIKEKIYFELSAVIKKLYADT